ncbi:MAG: glycosyltransferase family 39 protein [Anaerolineae bacterium]|nr:glycosyltransferase family 39 protein [Anaerolineae bacterium]
MPMIHERSIQSPSPRLRLALLIGIIILAAFLRLYHIHELPPGCNYDQSAYGVDALRIVRGEEYPIFFESNFGREPLFSYLVAACFLVIGVGPTAIRVASALVGILTVPAAYLLAQELFSEEDGWARWGGLLAAFGMAISYWDLTFSRMGLRAILVPLCETMTFYLTWRGLRTGSRRVYVGAGIFLGLSLYTYQAARAVPILVLLMVLYHVVLARLSLRRHLLNLILLFAVGLLVFAPLGLYFLRHPGSASLRIGQTLVVGTGEEKVSEEARTLATKLVENLLMFNVRGEDDPRYNLAGRPALNLFLSALFLMGLGVSLLRLRRPLYPFLLTWLAVMLAPAVLAKYGSNFKRAIGDTPAVALLVTAGALWLWSAIQQVTARLSLLWRHRLRTSAALVLIGGFALSGLLVYRDYFLVWGRDPTLFTRMEAGQAAIGEYVGQLPPDEQIYLSPVPADHQSVVFASGIRPGMKAFNGRRALVLPASPARNVTYIIVPGEDKTSLDRLAAAYPTGSIVAKGPDQYGAPYFLAFRVPAGTAAQISPQYPRQATWEGQIRLLGYDLDTTTYPAGGKMDLTLYWQDLAPMRLSYTVFTHLLGPYNPATSGPLWAQDDSEPGWRSYPTTLWSPGEIILDRHTLDIPANAPPGAYQIEIGWYYWVTQERLSVREDVGNVADHLILDRVTIGPAQ